MAWRKRCWSLTTEPTQDNLGTKVTVTTDSIDDGYQLESVKVTDRNEKAVSVTENDGKYSFAMVSHAVIVTANFIPVETQLVPPPDDYGNSDDSGDSSGPDELENPFVDVMHDDCFYDAVLWAVENNVTRRITSTSFRPDEIVTRAQAVTFLYRMDGSESDIANPFTDVEQGRYYYDAVLWAYEPGITQGITDTTFAPMENCLRGQIVSCLYRKFAA